MVTALQTAEALLRRDLAAEYRELGFDVSFDCPLDFFPVLQADMLARKGGQSRVVQVMSRAALSATPEIVQLAEVLDAMPDWSFDLRLVPEPERLPAPAEAQPLHLEDVSNRLGEATHLIELGHDEAGLLLAWSALEAVLRLQCAKVEPPQDVKVTVAEYVLDEATVQGVIYHEEYFRLAQIAQIRNAIMHGFSHRSNASELATELVQTAELLINRDPIAD